MSEHRTPADVAIELFELGNYDRLDALVKPARAEADESGPASVVRDQMLDVVHWLCQMRSEDEAEAAWHREALTGIQNRQQELKHSLAAVFHLVGDTPSGSDGGSDDPRAPMVRGESSSANALEGHESAPPSGMAIYCLGEFRVSFAGRFVENWNSGKGKAVLKFLVSCPEHRAGKEMLMELLWPEAEPHAARNNLNVAIYGLRQALSNVDARSVVLFGKDSYFLDPELGIWIDHEAFTRYLTAGQTLERSGQAESAMGEYRRAESLYQGDFLEEDRYEDWPDAMRRDLRDRYLLLLDRLGRQALDRQDYESCVEISRKMTAVEPCEEEPHRRLMLCWSRLGLDQLAIREFLECREMLARELEVAPSRAMVELFKRIQQRETV
jgi:DNA-binding SARP family transcriptional activator